MSSGIRDYSLNLGSNLVAIAVTVATQSVLARMLGPDGRGSYAVCILFSSILTLVFVVACDVAAEYFLASKRMGLSKTVISLLTIGSVSSVLAMVVGYYLIGTDLSFFEKADTNALYLALIMIPTGLFSSVFPQLFQAMKEFEWSACIKIANSVLLLFLTISLLWGLDAGVRGGLLAQLLSSVWVIAASLVLFRNHFSLSWVTPRKTDLWSMFHYGSRYYVGKLSNQANVQIGTILLATLGTKEEIGLFAVASVLTMKVMILPDSLSSVLLPRVAEDTEGRAELVAQSARIMLLVCGSLLVLLSMLVSPVVNILFGAEFSPSVVLVRILVIGVAARASAKVFVPYLVGRDRPGTVSIAVFLGVVTNLGTLVALWSSLGLTAAAVAMTAGYLVNALLLTLSFVRTSGLKLREIWLPRRDDWRTIENAFGKVRHRLGFSLKPSV